MSECVCDFRTRTVGDGCRYCNPQYYIGVLEAQAKEDAEKLAKVRELRDRLLESSTPPWIETPREMEKYVADQIDAILEERTS